MNGSVTVTLGTLDLVVTTEVISHTMLDHHGLACVKQKFVLRGSTVYII